MNTRALCLMGMWLVSPAWSQEAPADAPAISRRSFDLSNDTIRTIVRDTATSLSVPIRMPDEPGPERENLAISSFPPPEKTRPVEHKVSLPSPTSPSSGPLSSLVEVLLGLDDDVPVVRRDSGLACRWPDKMSPPAQGHESCPAVSGDPLRTPVDSPIYEPPAAR